MSFIRALVLLVSSLGLVQAQNYVGTPVNNSLPFVPGAEITYFNIHNPTGTTTNYTTLINYMNLNSAGNRLVPSQIKRAVVIIHGLQRDPGTYMANTLSALAQVQGFPGVNTNSVAVMTPYFPNGDDKNYGYPWTDGLSPGRGSTSNALVWQASNWASGANNQYPYYDQKISSYDCLDQIIQWFDNSTLFPNLSEIVIGGHSLGGQTTQRYAAVGKNLNTKARITYWVANPDSMLWFNQSRPLSTDGCSDYDAWREGLSNYTNSYQKTLVASGDAAVYANYQSKNIAYGRGVLDLGDDSSGCEPFTTGNNRNERFFNFISWFPPTCAAPTGSPCSTIDYVPTGHDAGAMMADISGQSRLFLDNFNGTQERAYDFGCPRLQAGDDPYPNPSCTTPIALPDNGTYAGGMTYVGCWSDTSPHVLPYIAWQGNTSTTIEGCTSACVAAGYSLAGAEYGEECYCGNSLSYQAYRTVDEGCHEACDGNANEWCGDESRLSLFSNNGVPTVNKAPGEPQTVGAFNYLGCYTDNVAGRAFTAKSEANSNMTIENCASYCAGYAYFGVEYQQECYCGNTIAGSNIPANASDCSETCLGDDLEFCGAGNRLNVYYANITGVSSTTTSTSTSASTTGSTTTTGTSSTSTSTSTALSCPASNATTFISSANTAFVIECYNDRGGGDLSMVYTNTLESCINTCATTATCVDVSWVYGGGACYMKSAANAGSTNSGVWGARYVSSGTVNVPSSTASSTVTSSTSGSSTSSSTPGSTTSTSVSSTSTTGSSTSTSVSSTSITSTSISSTLQTSSTSTSSAPAQTTTLACPASNGANYTTSSGETFVVECGTDHQGGDMGMVYVNGLQQCIESCGNTTSCVDVSLSGSACYLKSTLGAALSNGGVNGGRLVASASATPSKKMLRFLRA